MSTTSGCPTVNTNMRLRNGAIFPSPTDSKTITDLDGHGTHLRAVAAQVVPNAEVYVGRGVENSTSSDSRLEGEAGQEMYTEAESSRDNEFGDTGLEDTGELRLFGGLTRNGRPAEFVRVKKNGETTSVATGLPVDLNDEYNNNVERWKRLLSEEAEEDEAIMRSMARRRRSASAARLAPKRCREPGCDKEFKRLCDLTKHEKTHSRPWKCPVESCKYHDYGWPTEKEMDRHHNDKHSTAAPLYECHFKPCPFRSKRESNCKQHMEKAHGWEYVRSYNFGENREKEAATASVHLPRAYQNLYQDSPHLSPISPLPFLDEELDDEESTLESTPQTSMPPDVGNPTEGGDVPGFSSLEEPNQALTKDQTMKSSPEKDSKEPHAEILSNRRPLQPFEGLQLIGDEGMDYIKISALRPIPKATKSSGDRCCRDKPPRENRRRVLPVLIKKRQHLACPDSGSAKNIMSESFAKECNLKIRRRPKDIKLFELGSGKYISSIGRVSVSVQLLGHVLERRKRWFYVFATCPVPLILGMPFLNEAEIFTRNRHLLETCPLELSQISFLLWIGSSRNKSHDSPRNRFMCSLDGHELEAVADTGSDLNLMSLHCAKREGFQIDRRREARIRIQVGDATEMETIGQVQVHSFSLDWRKEPTLEKPSQIHDALQHNEKTDDEDNPEIIFHVLPGLPCDVIFGRELLEQADIFNLCFNSSRNLSTPKRNAFELRVLISLGPVAIVLPIPRRRRRKCALISVDQKEAHDDSRHAEMFRRTKREEEIAGLPVEQQFMARNMEERRIMAWNALHRTCRYCQLV